MNESRLRRSAGSLLVAEALLGAALVFAPLAIGTVQWWSLGVMAALATGAALATTLSRPRHLPWPASAALAVALFVGLQALPLPPAVLRALSPRAAELVEFHTGGTGWHALSLDPPATAREFVRLVAYAAAFFAASRVSTDSNATRRLTLVISAMTCVEIVVVVVHKLLGTSQMYGFVTMSQPGFLLGSFGNLNHLAGYLTLCVPLVVLQALRTRDTALRWTWWAICAGGVAIIALSASRSGILGLIAALVALVVVLRPRGQDARRLVPGLAALVLVGAGTALAVALDPVRRIKLASLAHPTRLLGDVKVRAWLDVPHLVRDYWVTGVGRGAFAAAFPAYKRIPDQLTFTHAESAPLQALADLGVLAGTALLVAWLIALVRGGQRRGMPQRAAAVAALVGITIHELGDFSLEAAGGVGITAAVLWGLVFPAEEHVDEVVHPAWRGARIGLACVATLLCVAAADFGYRHDLDRNIAALQILAQNDPDELEPLVRVSMLQHPAEPWFPFMAGVDLVRRRQPAHALRYLNRALGLSPTAWKPHRAIADALWLLGKKSQAILEYRLAYIGSGFHPDVVRVLLAHAGAAWSTGLEGFAEDDPTVLGPLASELEREGRDDDARLAAARLLEVRPDDLDAHRLLARVAFRHSRWEEVVARTGPLPLGDLETTGIHLKALDALGRTAEADKFLARVYDSSPTNAVALLLVERQLAQKQPDDALAVIDRIKQDDLDGPELARLHRVRAHALEARGRVREAIHEWLAAKRIEPGEEVLLELGSAYERQGMFRDALLAYREATRSTRTPSAETLARVARVQASMGTSPTLSGGGGAPSLPEESGLEDVPGFGEKEEP